MGDGHLIAYSSERIVCCLFDQADTFLSNEGMCSVGIGRTAFRPADCLIQNHTSLTVVDLSLGIRSVVGQILYLQDVLR